MIRIYADSTCDLTRELAEQYNIRIVPLYVRMGDRMVPDNFDLDPEELYSWSDRHKSTPSTASFSPEDASDAIREAQEAGDDIIFFGISLDMSSSCSVFNIAAQELDYGDHVFVVDSRNLGNGIALLILKAHGMIEAGNMTAAEIWLEVQKLIPRVRTSFVLDTVTYLYRGGRCSAVAAFTANALNLKPKIIVQGGRMSVATKYRGRQDAVIKKYLKDLKPQLARADSEFIFVYNSGVPQEYVDAARQEIADMKRFENIYLTRAGGVISSHCGPGTFSIMFLDGEEK